MLFHPAADNPIPIVLIFSQRCENGKAGKANNRVTVTTRLSMGDRGRARKEKKEREEKKEGEKEEKSRRAEREESEKRGGDDDEGERKGQGERERKIQSSAAFRSEPF